MGMCVIMSSSPLPPPSPVFAVLVGDVEDGDDKSVAEEDVVVLLGTGSALRLVVETTSAVELCNTARETSRKRARSVDKSAYASRLGALL